DPASPWAHAFLALPLIDAKPDETYPQRVLEVASIYSQACNLEPSNAGLAAKRAQLITLLGTRQGVPADLRAFAEKTKKDHDRDVNGISKKGDEALEAARDALLALKKGLTTASDTAKAATRRAPWVVDAWLALAESRGATSDYEGAISAACRATACDKELRGLSALATLVRDLKAGKKKFDLASLDGAAARDADAAAPVATDTTTFVKALLASTQALVSDDRKGARAKEGVDLSKDLVGRRPELVAYVFARGLGALAAGDHEDAMRELGFCALAADERGEMHYLHALAAARASASASDWRKAAWADDSLDALERAIAITPDLAKVAKEDADLKATAARLKQ
ncbi:MAG: hypothetical protein ACAI25_20080, partial [Planctomycetota bacterium]